MVSGALIGYSNIIAPVFVPVCRAVLIVLCDIGVANAGAAALSKV